MPSAVRFNASTMGYNRSCVGFTGNSWTVTFWVKLVTDRNGFSSIFSMSDNVTGWTTVWTRGDGTTLGTETYNSTTITGRNMIVGDWYYVARTYFSTTDGNVYHAAVGDGTTTEELAQSVNGVVIDAHTMYLNTDPTGGGGSWFDGSIAAVKIWTTRLTKAEIDAERATYAPVKTANLWAYYTFESGPQTTDNSGNGRALTQTGTPVLDSSGPPISAPTTTKAASFGGFGNHYTRSASGLNNSTSISWSCWFKMSPAAGRAPALNSDNGTNYVYLGTDSSGNVASMGTGGGNGTTKAAVTGEWVFAAATFDIVGANDWVYYALSPATSLTPTREFVFNLPTGWADANTFYIAGDSFTDYFQGSVAAVKIWTAALTQAEMEAEIYYYAAQRTANLWANYKFDSGPSTVDSSSNARTLTVTGTPTTDTSGPPLLDSGPPPTPPMFLSPIRSTVTLI